MSLRKRFLIIILTSLFTLLASIIFANDTTGVVILPTSVARQMFKDVKERDHLKFVLHKRDSTIKVYEAKKSIYEEEILSLKLSAINYQKIITNLEKVVEVRDAQLKDKDTKVRRGTTVAVLEAVALVVLIIIIL